MLVVRLLLANSLISGCSLALAQDSAVSQSFPSECRGFLRTKQTKLVGVWGSYGPPFLRSVLVVAFSPDGALALSGVGFPPDMATSFQAESDNKTLKLWEVTSGQPIRIFEESTRAVTSAAFSPDGKLVLAGYADGALILWDVSSGEKLLTFSEHEGSVKSLVFSPVAFSPDGKVVLSLSGRLGGSDQTITLWDVASGEAIQTLPLTDLPGVVRSATFVQDGRLALLVCSDGTLRFLDMASGKELRTIDTIEWNGTVVASSSDGTLIAAGSYDGTLRLWNARNGEVLQTFTGHKDAVSAIAFSPNAEIVFSASMDKTVRLWDAASGEPVDEIDLTTSEAYSYSLAISSDGRAFLVGTHRGVILHFELVGGEVSR